MNAYLELLARRVADDPFFLAPVLNRFAHSEHLDDSALAARLGCDADALTRLRLCSNPPPDAPKFWNAIRQIAESAKIDPDILADIVRRGQTLLKVRPASESSPIQQPGFLMAARDDEPEDES